MKIKQKEKFLARFILMGLNTAVLTNQIEGDNKLVYEDILKSAKQIVNYPIDNLIEELIKKFKEVELHNITEGDEVYTNHLKTDEEWFELVCRLTEDVKDSI